MALAGTLATALMVLTAPAATADGWPTDWGGEYGEFNPDRGAHTFCFHEAEPPVAALRTRMVAAMDYLAASTEATTFEMVPCDTSSAAGQTDVVWRGASVTVNGTEAIGLTECRRRFANGLCDRYRVTVNGSMVRSHYGVADNRNRQYRKTACHELGHRLGLNHFSAPHESCQRVGWTGTIADAWTRTWTVHHRGHIDDWF